MVWIIIVVFVL